jgi:hypothetical protein
MIDALARDKYPTLGSPPEFFMSTYLINIVSVDNPFLAMGWS